MAGLGITIKGVKEAAKKLSKKRKSPAERARLIQRDQKIFESVLGGLGVGAFGGVLGTGAFKSKKNNSRGKK